MSDSLVITLALLIPLAGTTLGSATVFFLKKQFNPKLQKALSGFASGVMVAAAFWSLLQPAISTYGPGDFRKWFVPALGFVLGVGFMLLLTPLVEMWTKISKGDEWTDFWLLPALAVFLILTDYYFKGERIVLSNYKTAAGVFEQDKYLALIQGIVNLILSIWLVQTKLGIAGIYVGTVVSGIIANITKPIIIYNTCFDKSAVSYFIDSFKYIASMTSVMGICYFIRQLVMPVPTVTGFIVMAVIITVVFNSVYLLLYGRSEEFKYLCGKLKSRKA